VAKRICRVQGLRALVFLAAAGLAPATAHAQAATTQAKIEQAIALYDRFEIEAARPLLQEVLSSNWVLPISQEQRVTALKYLGASFAVIGKADSAMNFFWGALGYDAFTDLDRNKFSPLELAAFDQAKDRLFRVGMRPLTAKVLDPKSADPTESKYPVRITTTQRAEITITAVLKKPGAAGDSLVETVFSGINDGTQTIPWNGMIQGQLAPSGSYEMRIRGTNQKPAHETADQKLEFTVRQYFEPLEEELPPLGAADTVVASYDARSPLWDFVKGAALGLAVGTMSKVALDTQKLDAADKNTWNAHWMIAGGVGVGTGLLSFSYRRQHLLRPEAVAENARRRQMRLEFNRNVQLRNADRLDKTKLLIQPR
jgi:hypothetical protein